MISRDAVIRIVRSRPDSTAHQIALALEQATPVDVLPILNRARAEGLLARQVAEVEHKGRRWPVARWRFA